jgi:hypothetical protein
MEVPVSPRQRHEAEARAKKRSEVMWRTWILMMLLLASSTLVVSGCDATSDDDSSGDDDDATAGDDDDDATADDDDAAGPCDDPAAMREDALENGEQILAGVTLKQSTPIADLVTDPASFDGQVLQIEGWVTEVCPMEGCWVNLTNGAGDGLQVKTGEGTVDHSEYTEPGRYHIAEGVFDEEQMWVWIVDHGAMAGTIVCD